MSTGGGYQHIDAARLWQRFDRQRPPNYERELNLFYRWHLQPNAGRWVPWCSGWPQQSARRCDSFLTAIQKGHCTDR